jgi:hypothetical protein
MTLTKTCDHLRSASRRLLPTGEKRGGDAKVGEARASFSLNGGRGHGKAVGNRAADAMSRVVDETSNPLKTPLSGIEFTAASPG